MNIPLELDAIVVTVGEQIESPEQEANMDWRYKENEFVLEINEATFTNVFETLPYRAKKYYRCEHHFAHYMNAEWLFGRKNKGIVIDGCGVCSCSVFTVLSIGSPTVLSSVSDKTGSSALSKSSLTLLISDILCLYLYLLVAT